MLSKIVLKSTAALLVVLALSACTYVVEPVPGPEGATPESLVEPSAALTADALQNATYSGIYDEPVTLADGLYEGEPYVAGDTSRPTVEYVDGAERYGDLDGDGVADAVVFLVERGGGTGAFIYIAAQLSQNGQPVDASAVWIGDRIRVKSAGIANGQVLLEVVVEGPGDGACCPSHNAEKTYALQDGLLAELPSEDEELVRVSGADLDGTTWVLRELGEGQPALDEPAVTLAFQGDQIGGSGGCNNYNAGFTLGDDNPFVMEAGPVVATMMACPEPILNQESVYFQALEAVSQWSYWFGDLALYYVDDQGLPVRLLFVAADDLE